MVLRFLNNRLPHFSGEVANCLLAGLEHLDWGNSDGAVFVHLFLAENTVKANPLAWSFYSQVRMARRGT